MIFMIDLHTHTVCSDGADTPLTVFEKASDLGLELLSITDHNSVMAYFDPDLQQRLQQPHLPLLPGIEITCMFEGEVVEVLGYGFDLQKMKEQLPEHVLGFADKQNREFDLVRSMLEKSGAVYDLEQTNFDPSRESCRKSVWKELLRHPENDRLFFSPDSRKTSRSFTRQEIYNPQSPLYVDEQSLYPTVREAADLIHACGGIAFLAHLYEYANADALFGRMEDIVRDNHLDGLECRHSCFQPEDTERLLAFCKDHDLLTSGGSDYHGSRKPDVVLGNRPDMQVPASILDDWPEDILRTAL